MEQSSVVATQKHPIILFNSCTSDQQCIFHPADFDLWTSPAHITSTDSACIQLPHTSSEHDYSSMQLLLDTYRTRTSVQNPPLRADFSSYGSYSRPSIISSLPHSCWETCQGLIKQPRSGSRSKRSFKAPPPRPSSSHRNQQGLAKWRNVDSSSSHVSG